MSLTYFEILQYFNEDYIDFVNQKMNYREALARTLDEYENVMNVGEIQKMAVYIAYGDLALEQIKILISAKDKLVNTLRNIKIEMLKEKLTNIEFEHFLQKRKYILDNIDKFVTIDNPHVNE